MQNASEKINMRNKKHNKVDAAEVDNNKTKKTIIKCRSLINY